MRKTIKRILVSVLTVAMLLTAAPLAGYALSESETLNYLIYKINDGKVIITDCDRSVSGELTIPSTIDGYPVTSIGSSAFYGCTGLTSVTIPDSVTSIGYYAFALCTGLTSIVIPDRVTSIGHRIFTGCIGLTSITIPESVTSVDDYAFEDCTGLKSVNYMGTREDWCKINFVNLYSNPVYYAECLYINGEPVGDVTIPNGITNIDYLFRHCKNLTSITIPDSVTIIGEYAFEGCTGLTSVEIPDSVTAIGSHAFYGCTGLTSMIIPNSVTRIEVYTFYGCTGLTSITIPNSVTYIDVSAFRCCTGLTSITVDSNNKVYDSRENCNAIIETIDEHDHYRIEIILGCKNTIIPDSVSSIGDYAFYHCTGLTNITFHDGLSSIGNFAFDGCTGLTSISIPKSVTSIGNAAFCRCSGLKSITVDPNNKVYDSRENCNAIIETVFDSNQDIYNSNLIQGCQNTIIPDGVTSIVSGAFDNCYGLTSIKIPDSVTSIVVGAFDNCYGITSITVNSNNKAYDSRENCNAIIETKTNKLIQGCKNTIIPKGVTSICNYAFRGCTGLKSITIPDSVTSIGYFAFSGCTGLTSITIPDSVTSIGDCAFEGCTGLTSITIPDSVTRIEWRVFYGCTGLTSITIPDSVTRIGVCAFERCTKITDVYYTGSESDWNKIYFEIYYYYSDAAYWRTGNECLTSATIHYNSSQAHSHTYTAIEIVAPTCTEQGYTKYVCECSDSYKADYIPAKGHTDGEWKITRQPTLTQEGERTLYCKECGQVIRTESIPMLTQGKVYSVTVDDISLNYKKSVTLNPVIDVDDGVNYTVEYLSSNPSVARVDENGNVYGAKKGSTEITVTVTDEFGNTVTDTCNVKVNYSFGQWLIVIFLFGWIWY